MRPKQESVQQFNTLVIILWMQWASLLNQTGPVWGAQTLPVGCLTFFCLT